MKRRGEFANTEDIYDLMSEAERDEIRKNIMNNKKYRNLGYCFCTFASVD